MTWCLSPIIAQRTPTVQVYANLNLSRAIKHHRLLSVASLSSVYHSSSSTSQNPGALAFLRYVIAVLGLLIVPRRRFVPISGFSTYVLAHTLTRLVIFILRSWFGVTSAVGRTSVAPTVAPSLPVLAGYTRCFQLEPRRVRFASPRRLLLCFFGFMLSAPYLVGVYPRRVPTLAWLVARTGSPISLLGG
jgi:hypothetical protein